MHTNRKSLLNEWYEWYENSSVIGICTWERIVYAMYRMVWMLKEHISDMRSLKFMFLRTVVWKESGTISLGTNAKAYFHQSTIK